MPGYLEKARPFIRRVFENIDEGDIHGYDHALEVEFHARNGIASYPHHLSASKKMAILLAALLHDVDDEKMFPENRDYENARSILRSIQFPKAELVIEMISLVSFSKNGISTVYFSHSKVSHLKCISADDIGIFLMSKKTYLGSQHAIPKWKLIPRLADRVVALGTRGVGRCLGFGGQHGRPIYTSETPRFTNIKDLIVFSTRVWLMKSKSPNCSDIDYFIYGLIPRCFMVSGIEYFDNLTREGSIPIIKLILLFGQQGYITRDQIIELLGDDEKAIQMILTYVK